jgi:hypothetical protein
MMASKNYLKFKKKKSFHYITALCINFVNLAVRHYLIEISHKYYRRLKMSMNLH